MNAQSYVKRKVATQARITQATAQIAKVLKLDAPELDHTKSKAGDRGYLDLMERLAPFLEAVQDDLIARTAPKEKGGKGKKDEASKADETPAE